MNLELPHEHETPQNSTNNILTSLVFLRVFNINFRKLFLSLTFLATKAKLSAAKLLT